MWFLTPALQAERLYEGFAFTIQEGRKVVGRGRVTRVLNQALRALRLNRRASRRTGGFRVLLHDLIEAANLIAGGRRSMRGGV